MNTATRVIGAVVVGGAALSAVIAWKSHWEASLVAQGDAQGAARIQGQWDAQTATIKDAATRETAQKFRNAERIALEDAQREEQRAAALATANTAVRGLRAEVDRLNRRPTPYADGAAGITACAREASIARELLGESSERYRSVAAEADRLRDQVIGLQDFASSVCQAGTSPEVAPSE